MNNACIVKDKREYNLSFTPPVKLSELVRAYGFAFPCGGAGLCGKCKVRVEGSVSPITECERSVLGENSNLRLACQTSATGDVRIYLPSAENLSKAKSVDSFLPSSPLGNKNGFVIDVGTTTVYASLYDLRSGQKLAHTAFQNPQASFGADVLSRMQSAQSGHEAEIRRCIQKAIENACLSLLTETNLDSSMVDAAVLVGNTAMLYLLFGVDTKTICVSPFACTERFGEFLNVPFLPLQSGAKVFVPPIISAFLGADITAASVHCMDENVHVQLWTDLGTNGETVLRVGENMIACSCAVGPAFEGVGIECGMPAIPGAVSGVRQMGGVLSFDTIGNNEPIGLCGSALVDFIACLLKSGKISSDGVLQSEDRVYLPGTDVYLSQRDIRAFQLAKSAVRTGIEILMQEAGIKQVEKLSLAGTFGSHLNLRNACTVGMIPPSLQDVTEISGNAAAIGAAEILMNSVLIDKCRAIVKNTKTISLTDYPTFENRLMQYISFSERGVNNEL